MHTIYLINKQIKWNKIKGNFANQIISKCESNDFKYRNGDEKIYELRVTIYESKFWDARKDRNFHHWCIDDNEQIRCTGDWSYEDDFSSIHWKLKKLETERSSETPEKWWALTH